jgi:hypothetical protein
MLALSLFNPNQRNRIFGHQKQLVILIRNYYHDDTFYNHDPFNNHDSFTDHFSNNDLFFPGYNNCNKVFYISHLFTILNC